MNWDYLSKITMGIKIFNGILFQIDHYTYIDIRLWFCILSDPIINQSNCFKFDIMARGSQIVFHWLVPLNCLNFN